MDAEKGVPYLLGSNLAYLLCLIQLAAHKYLPTVCKELAGGPKHQHMTMLQMSLNDTAWRLSIW